MSPIDQAVVRRKLQRIVGMLPRDLALALAPSAGLRHRLVHEYDRIDDAIVLEATARAQDLYARYVAAIDAYLTGATPA